MNLPSGEISAPSSAPSKFVIGVNLAPASGAAGTGTADNLHLAGSLTKRAFLFAAPRAQGQEA